jgi:hypothetical protein
MTPVSHKVFVHLPPAIGYIAGKTRHGIFSHVGGNVQELRVKQGIGVDVEIPF